MSISTTDYLPADFATFLESQGIDAATATEIVDHLSDHLTSSGMIPVEEVPPPSTLPPPSSIPDVLD
jgi:hypothetical protein